MQIAPYARERAQEASVLTGSPFVRRGEAGDARAAGERRHEADTGRPPVLFLHGWGVGPHSYGAPLERLGRLGCRVVAPAQPGFGGTPSLPGEDCNFPGYARWAVDHLDSLGIDEPVMVVGHSFGGGVAIQVAHDHPERVLGVVICNGVGGFPWAGPPGTVNEPERPWWEWGRFLGADLLALPTLTRVLPALLGEAVPNIVQNPLGMWRVAEFVRRAHLVDELAAVAESGTTVTLVWSDRDRLVPHAGFAALCRAADIHGTVVPGNHSWLIAEPDRFADIVLRSMVDSGVIEAAMAAAS